MDPKWTQNLACRKPELSDLRIRKFGWACGREQRSLKEFEGPPLLLLPMLEFQQQLIRTVGATSEKLQSSKSCKNLLARPRGPYRLSHRKPQERGVKALSGAACTVLGWIRRPAATSLNQTVRRETLWILKAISQISGTPHPCLCSHG